MPKRRSLERETLDLRRRVLGPDHPDTARSLYNLAGMVLHLGRSTEALSLLRQAADHGLSRPDALDMANDSDFQPLRSDPRFTAPRRLRPCPNFTLTS